MKEGSLISNERGGSLQWVFLATTVVFIAVAGFFFWQTTDLNTKVDDLTSKKTALTSERDAAKTKLSKGAKFADINNYFWGNILDYDRNPSYDSFKSEMDDKVKATGDAKLKQLWQATSSDDFSDGQNFLDFVQYLGETLATTLK